MIRWLWAFADCPIDQFDRNAEFWCAATESTLSPRRGPHGEFATFLPETGDPRLKIQGVHEGTGGAHIDFDVDDVDAVTHAAVEVHGASIVMREGVDLSVMRSPGGQLFCITRWAGESRRPPVVVYEDGLTSRVDQVCIDINPELFERECAFWSGFTGWPLRQSTDQPEFTRLLVAQDMPLHILLQRRDSSGPPGAHIDVACPDVEGIRAKHESLGARKVADGKSWTVMRDPAGGVYCLTGRDAHTGR